MLSICLDKCFLIFYSFVIGQSSYTQRRDTLDRDLAADLSLAYTQSQIAQTNGQSEPHISTSQHLPYWMGV